MADGELDRTAPLELLPRARCLTLRDSVAPGRHLEGQCPSCSCAEALPARHWVALGDALTPLASIETRLRCTCGARRVFVRICAGDEPPEPPTERAIWRFH